MDNGNKQNDPNNRPKNPMPPLWLIIGIVFLLLTFIINIISSSVNTKSQEQVEYSQFVKLVDSGYVSRIKVEDDQILFELKNDSNWDEVIEILKTSNEGSEKDDATSAALSILQRTYSEEELKEMNEQLLKNQVYYTGRVYDPGLTDRLIEHEDLRFYTPVEQNNALLNIFSSWIFPIIVMYLIYFLLFRGLTKRMGSGEGGGLGGMMNVGKSKAKVYNLEKNTGVSFADVAGQDEAKESLIEMVDFLKNPEKYKQIGAKQPKGALLVGPPGTGKTLLAKAVAGEVGVPFFSLSGSEFVEMFVGVGASRVRDLFAQASKQSPCIIFIDEIDAIGKSRDNQIGGNDEREQTLNQLLAEMDGFDSTKAIVILAATNRPEILDKALLRPGRFDRRIIVEKPDLPGREAILQVHLAKVTVDSSVDVKEVALSTSGATGADLANMVNEAALRAVRMNRSSVTQEDLMEAVELIIAGKEKKDRILNPTEKRMVAFHEVGHALASALQKDGMPVQKITIVPRTMGALGYTMNMPEEERYLMTKSELYAQIVTLVSGRAAEELIFNESSTGASNDIERATKLARSMVTQYGMSEAFGMMGLESVQNQYLDGRNVSTCSEATGAQIDEEVRTIIDHCYNTAKALLEDNQAKLKEISEFLIEKETITGVQFMEILNHDATSINAIELPESE